MLLANRFDARDLLAFVASMTAIAVALATRYFHAKLGPVMKVCRACGAHYRRLAWQKLSYLGRMDDGQGIYVLELRNCPCGSTLALRA